MSARKGPSEPRFEIIIQRRRAFNLSSLPAKESRKGTPCRIPMNDKIDICVEATIIATLCKRLPGESRHVAFFACRLPPVPNILRIIACLRSDTCTSRCRIQRRILPEDVSDQAYSSIQERCSLDRAKVASGDVEAMTVRSSPQVPDECVLAFVQAGPAGRENPSGPRIRPAHPRSPRSTRARPVLRWFRFPRAPALPESFVPSTSGGDRDPPGSPSR